MKIEFETIQRVKLPFDRRHESPSKNYGIHGLDVWFILKGPKGATQYMFNAGIYLPHVEEEYLRRNIDLFSYKDCGKFSGYDVGYHAKEPQFEGQQPHGDCDILGGQCYYDGSGLFAAEKTKEFFSIRGESIEPHIWKFLEEQYLERFGE